MTSRKLGKVSSYYNNIRDLRKAHHSLYNLKKAVITIRESYVLKGDKKLLTILARCPYKADESQLEAALYDAYRFLRRIIPDLRQKHLLTTQSCNLVLRSVHGLKVK